MYFDLPSIRVESLPILFYKCDIFKVSVELIPIRMGRSLLHCALTEEQPKMTVFIAAVFGG